MKLVTRYVVREHVGPLVFALSALTSLLMLQYVARQLANLAGKGLPWRAIAQFFVLSLPFTIAMTLPMAVLVATLFAFGRMAAEHEITAFKASGVRVRSLMAPVLFCAFLLSCGMVAFNDQVLPRANHRLRILQQDIARTKPTLALRDQAMNTISDGFYLRVDRSDAETNRMKGVTIYDLSRGTERKTVYADSGLFLLAPNGKDLQLRLFDGHSQEFVKGDARRFQRTFFRQQTVQVRGVSQGFEASQSDTYKGDREMSICEMQRKYAVSAVDFARIRDEYIGWVNQAAPKGTKKLTVPRGRPKRDALAHFYCVTVPSLLQVKTAHAAEVETRVIARPPVQQPPVQQPPAQQPAAQQPAAQQPPAKPPAQSPPPPRSQQGGRRTVAPPPKMDSLGRPIRPDAQQPARVIPKVQGYVPPDILPNGQPAPKPVETPFGQAPVRRPIPSALPSTTTPNSPGVVPLPGAAVALPVPDSAAKAAASAAGATVAPSDAVVDSAAMARGSLLAAQAQLTQSREALDSLAVEIQKKFALSFACVVFVLFGPPIALRFPRGGVGVTIGVSIVVFGLYYICLMGGEALADKGRLPAIVAMWIANFIFTVAGIILLWRVESTTDSSRGGGIRDWLHDRQTRKMLAREQQARADASAAPVVTA